MVFALLFWIGWAWPLQNLKAYTERRQEELVRQLPFAIDLLGSAMRSGLEFGAALRYYTGMGVEGALREEFSRVLADVSLGKPFVEALKAFDEALRVGDAIFSSKEMADADRDADLAWWALNGFLKAMTSHPNPAKRDAAIKVFMTFSQYENPTSLSYATEYGIMERLLSDLKALPSALLETADVVEWIKDLEEKCTTFVQMYSIRVQDKASKMTGLTKTARVNAVNAYRDMITMVNALLVVSPEADLVRFASHVNELISKKLIVMKSKKTRAANAAAAADPSDEEGIDVL
jgi:hypothetical protein